MIRAWKALPSRVAAVSTPMWVTLTALAFGGAIRVLHVLARPSLWTDEAALATNIVQRGFSELLDPLASNQGAPVLFLWVQRAVVLVAGNNEYALRLVPLLAGIATIGLAFLIGRRLVSPWVGAVAAVLVALSPSLVRYSWEVKQYSSDAALTLVLVLLALHAAERPHDARTLARLAGGGVLAMWASHPAALTAAALGLILAAGRVHRRDRTGVLGLMAVGATWTISATIAWFVSFDELGGNQFLRDYWDDGFAPQPLSPGSFVAWLARALVDIAEDPGGLAFGVIAIAAAVGGLVAVARRRPLHGAQLVAPGVAAVIAASLGGFPLMGRMALFLVPLLLLALAALVELDRSGRWTVAASLLIVVLAGGGARDVVVGVVDPPRRAESRAVFEHVAAHMEPGDQVWIHDVTVETYRYYAPIVGVSADARTRWLDEETCATAAPSSLHTAAEGGRVWVVFAYTLSTRPDDEAELLRRHLDAQAQRVASFDRHDAFATLYDFGSAPSAEAAPPAVDGLACLGVSPEDPTPPTGLATGPFGTGSSS